MAIFPGSAIPSAAEDYTIDNSLRFDDGDTPYMSWTPSAANSVRTKWTISAWVKLGNIGTQRDIFSAGDGSGKEFALSIGTNYKLAVYNYSGGAYNFSCNTDALLRDPSAWYHILCRYDSTDGTTNDRVQLFVNGERQSLDNNTQPSSSYAGDFWSYNGLHYISKYPLSGSNHFDGYLAEVYSIDGTAYTASDFGELDSTTNQWIPKDASGLTFGTNGFYQKYAGTELATSFEDSAWHQIHTVTAAGNTHTDTSVKKIGTASAQMDGTGDYLSIPHGTDFNFDTGDFTIEFWFYTETLPAGRTQLFSKSSADRLGVQSNLKSDGTINLAADHDSASPWQLEVNSAAGVVSVDTWYHIAYVRASNVWTVYLDGTSVISADPGSLDFDDTSVNLLFGSMNWTHDDFTGYMDEIRVSKGIARYSSSFNPSTTAFTADQYTKLLLHCDGADGGTTFTDSSNAAPRHTITAYGDVTNTRAVKKVGESSIKFDGNGDYFSVPASSDWNRGTGDWTVEAWFQNAGGTSGTGYGNGIFPVFTVGVGWTAAFVSDWLMWYSFDEEQMSVLDVGGNQYNFAQVEGDWDDTDWHHIAIVRNGNDLKYYFDGTQTGSTADVTGESFGDSTNTVYIGRSQGGAEAWSAYWNGYQDEYRVSDTARYTGNFTPSTTAFTADANTLLLIHSNWDGGLGLDSSGEGNNFTVTNLVATDQMVDTPTNNFATMNPLAGGDGSGGGQVLSEGNLKDTAATDNSGIALTMGLPGSGKWYWEWEVEDYEAAMFIGIYAPEKVTLDQGTTTSEGFWTYRGDGGSLYGGGTSIAYGDSWNTNGDIVGVAADMDNGTLHFAVNNVWEGTATNDLLTTGYDWVPALKMHNTSSGVLNLNAGSDSSFAGEKTAQGNQDGNEKGDFYYTPPTLGDLEQTAKMTGASAPSPNAVTASAYDTVNDNKSWYAFDSIRSRKWGLYDASNVNSNELPQTLTYDFGSGNGCALNKYRILGDDNPNRMPNTWSIHGSNDDSDYTLLDTQTGITWPSDYSWKTYTFSNTTSYRYLRFTYTSNNGDSNYAQLMELQYYDTARTGNFLALCTDNLSTPEIALPDENFNTLIWTGDGTSTRAITGVGFTPDLTWGKNRDTGGTYHFLMDSVRDVGYNLYSNSNDAQALNATILKTLDSDGFTVGSGDLNTNTKKIVAWNWKAGGTPTADNSAGAGATPTAGSVKIDGSNLGSALAGTIAATRLSANTTSGFSVVEYPGNNTAGATIAHGLSVTPEMIFVKQLDNGTSSWRVYDKTLGANQSIYLNLLEAASGAGNGHWNNTSPTATVFTVRDGDGVNSSSTNYVAYCFHSIEGYSRVGSYEGNGDADGTFIYTGFKPAYVLIKSYSNGSTNWLIHDDARDPYNPAGNNLNANEPDAENEKIIDMVSNGFKAREDDNHFNGDGYDYIYYAVAESPFKTSNAR